MNRFKCVVIEILIFMQEPNIWERRSNLNGVTLVDCSNSWDKIAISDLSLDPNLQRHTGFVPEVLWRLSANLNFNIQLMFPPDGQWGSMMDNGTWTGMVGQLVKGSADISTGGLSIITERARAIDFTQPVLLDTITLTSQVEQLILVLDKLTRTLSRFKQIIL